MPACGDVGERALRRVLICAPAGDFAVPLSDGAVVPVAGADVGVAAFWDVVQLGRVAAPTADDAVGAEGALMLAARV